jgi:DUF971 family protein
MTDPHPWPLDLCFDRQEGALRIAWDSGETNAIPFELLRVQSPSAEVQGHAGKPILVAGKRGVGVADALPVGRYAVRIRFDDGHETGIFSWALLHQMAKERHDRMAAYEAALAAAGLSRDAP